MTDIQDPTGAWPRQRMNRPLCPNVLGEWGIPRTADAVPEARHHIGELARDILAYSSQVGDVELMAGELLANAVEHGAGGMTWIRVTANNHVVRVEVRDEGTDLQHAPAPNLPPPEHVHGRGLFLVAAFAKTWGVEPDASGTTAWFEVVSP